jgi:signal transduction histidine kinase
MTMLSLSRRLGITPRTDHEYDPTAAGWLDSGRPEGAHQGVGQRPLVPQQWAGTSAVRDRERAHHAADDHTTSGPIATARGPHPLGGAESEAAPPGASRSASDAGPAETRPVDRRAAPDGAWPEICDQFGSHMLVLAEQLRATLNVLEEGEGDPERLKRLYQVDHAVTRMRLASRQLVTLAGRNQERVAGFTTSVLDVIRMASSAIEWYPQVAIGSVVELAVAGYAADDIATLVSALLDNATRFSPGMVTVSCHLLEHGGVMFRIEDTGLGMARDQVARLNVALAGAVPDVSESTARHTGFPVVHRIARKHSIGVRFASRRPPGTGTLAMVTLPPELLCAMPAQGTPHRPPSADRAAQAATAASAAPDLPRRERTALVEPASPQPALPDAAPPDATPLGLTAPDSAPRELTPPQAGPPEPVSPKAISPGPVSAEPVSPDAISPGPVSPEAISPEATSPEAVSPEAESPESASAEALPSEPVSPQVVASERVRSATASPESVAAEADQDPPPCELPRREPVGLRVDDQKPAEAAAPPPQPQQAAARLAFANDLSAFSQGIQEALAARGITGGLVSALFDGPVIKEGTQS